MSQIRFGIVGGGWRPRFYLRIARALPERFAVTCVLDVNSEAAEKVHREYGVHTCGSLDELLATKPEFVVVAVPWGAAPGCAKEVWERGMPVLEETPPAPDLDGLVRLYTETDRGRMIQVSEQYQFHPMHAARIAVAQSGLLGDITEAQVCFAHGYHGVNMMRKLLGVGFEPVTITAKVFNTTVAQSPGRDGESPSPGGMEDESQTLAWFDYGKKLGVYDFTGSQYLSWIRSTGTLVRGTRGEIRSNSVRYLKDHLTPIAAELVRHDTGLDGNLEGFSHKGVSLAGDWIYRNPVYPARLADDEIAIADCLIRMSEFVQGGPGFNSLAEAAHDHYLALMIYKSSVELNAPVTTEPQVWCA